MAMVDDLTDEDGIDGPLERRLARADRAPRRRPTAPPPALIELDEVLAARPLSD